MESELKLYIDPIAPNARRVLMFLFEKGIEIEVATVDTMSGEHLSPDFLAKNTAGQIPVLQLPSGEFLAESMAICRYFDERFPTPSLFGRELEERARIHMWSRRMELILFNPAVELGHHTHPMFQDHHDQIPAYAELNRIAITKAYAMLDTQLSTASNIAGAEFTIADIIAYCGIELARLWGAAPDPAHGGISRWHRAVEQRGSASIARYAP